MTREEAIKQLDTMWKMLTSAYDDIADSHVVAYTMAVDALKAQGTCEDAVSRQTLQKELALYPIDDVTSEDEAGYNRAINDVQKMVLHLPPVQTEVPNTNVGNNDLISRQAAIDATWFEPSYTDPLNVLTEVRDRLKVLPSAQLERKKGKWIGKYPVTSACSECNYLIHDSKVKVFAYCPNCGADMRGEWNEND